MQRPTSLARAWGWPSVLLSPGRTMLANDQSHSLQCNLLRTKSLPQAGTDTNLGMERGRQSLYKASQNTSWVSALYQKIRIQYITDSCPDQAYSTDYTILITIFLIFCKRIGGLVLSFKTGYPPEQKQKKKSPKFSPCTGKYTFLCVYIYIKMSIYILCVYIYIKMSIYFFQSLLQI